MRKNRLLWSLATLAAFAYLAVMVISGALPEQRQLVKFEAKGLMTLPPERIARIDLVRGGKTVTFVRSGDAGWIQEDKGPLPKALAEKLSLAVQIMNTSGPVRVMEATEHSFSGAPRHRPARVRARQTPAFHHAIGRGGAGLARALRRPQSR